MYNSFAEAKAALKDGVKKSKKGTKIKSFSKNDFNILINALLNDSKYNMETVSIVDGKLTNVSTPIIEDLRTKFIMPILIEFGVPKTDAARIVDEYKFKSGQTQVLYNFIIEAIYQYIDSDKKLNFPARKDFTGSIHLNEVEETMVERDIRDIKDHKTIVGHKKEKRAKHKTLVKKSTCPVWLRHTI